MSSEILTARQMTALEHGAMEAGHAQGGRLMALAGRGVVDAVLTHWPSMAGWPGQAEVLAGPGNNGGDGYVIARLLTRRGWRVRVHAFGDPSRLPADAAAAMAAWLGEGGVVLPLNRSEPDLRQADLVVDALFGGGLARPLPPAAAALVPDWPTGRAVAVDAPSGLCLDSGRALGAVLPAALTVTFQRPRLGHHLADGPSLCGTLAVADIGLDGWITSRSGPEHVRDARALKPPAPNPGGHKYGRGHVLVLSGGVGRGGAARLAAHAALRSGAGLATVGVPPSALIENAARLDAVMVAPLPDPDALAQEIRARRIAAIVLGPGFGHGARLRDFTRTVLATGLPAVLDADALSAWSGDPEGLFGQLHAHAVLTPHGGEFARLFPDLAARLAEPPERGPAFSRIDAAREAAARAGSTVLLKGADTVVATPDGPAWLAPATYADACAWLATAGAGDVLAGTIAAHLANGMEPGPAAACAADRHQRAARRLGPGMTADDLPAALAMTRGKPSQT